MNVVVDYWVSPFSKKKVFRKSVRVQTVSLWKKFKLVCIELDWRRILLSLPASYIVVRSTCTTSQIQQNKILFTWMWPALSHPILQSIQFSLHDVWSLFRAKAIEQLHRGFFLSFGLKVAKASSFSLDTISLLFVTDFFAGYACIGHLDLGFYQKIIARFNSLPNNYTFKLLLFRFFLWITDDPWWWSMTNTKYLT